MIEAGTNIPTEKYIQVDFSKKTGEIANIEMDWKYFLKQPRDFRVFILEELLKDIKKDSTERKKEWGAWLKKVKKKK